MAGLLHKKITDSILKAYYAVYNQLGYGFLEKVYQNAMYFELKSLGYKVEAQKQIKVYFKSQLVGEYYADLLVEDKVIVELKACELLMNVHIAQLMNYLKATEIEVGLLLNFGEDPEFKRIIYTNDKKQTKKSVIIS
ncbi:GxxExxY protein [Flavobacterium sp. PL02]|jgi:GxxExxY protein|uniref:GxxExxY protein n=1 Tax=Flavobacterium sp. PL02 TaxID=3088354 RepID=UPI002B23AA73|nr:GxxExxY protein [Flavobacterium sp. PL02]MEA9415240.1 GxxExxY protein [Flavobacterium sp. PL02]